MAIRGDEEAATLVTFSSTAGTLEYREGGKTDPEPRADCVPSVRYSYPFSP